MDNIDNKSVSIEDEVVSNSPPEILPAERTELVNKLKQYFSEMTVRKSASNSHSLMALGIPSYIRDWLVMRFSDNNGVFDIDHAIDYVKHVVPDKEQWNVIMMDMLFKGETKRFLAKIKISFDSKNRLALFELPDYAIPRHKGEAIADWNMVEKNKQHLLVNNEVWGIVSLSIENIEKKGNVFKLVDFTPFCPYSINLDYYKKARTFFTIEEWIDVLLGGSDYSPNGYANQNEKLAFIKRLLPFVEKRLNLIELAPKETGKSYVFSQVSKYGWLVSGGSVTRAKMFYDLNKKVEGLVSNYDYVALDEIQSINFDNPQEMQGVLKGYLESGEYRIGAYHSTGESGMILLGNIDASVMDTDSNMFANLPAIFRESALVDRFHGFIKGWELPKMREELKADDWALNTEYFSEIMHLLREESVYRAVVDDLLSLPKNAGTRDTEAIKRICTAYVKLLYPQVTNSCDMPLDEFRRYCLIPAIEMRAIVKKQLAILDPGEFGSSSVPNITVREF